MRTLLVLLSATLFIGTSHAQEIVLRDGSRLKGTIKNYENGMAYILLVNDSGRSMLTTLPESAIDKAATEEAQSVTVAEPPTPISQDPVPYIPPSHDPVAERVASDEQEPLPSISALASQERGRRRELQASGDAPGRVYTNEDVGSSIPTPDEVVQIASLADAPTVNASNTASSTDVKVEGMAYYTDRLNKLRRDS